jgi:hypothetical protein
MENYRGPKFCPMAKTSMITLSTQGLQSANQISRKDFRFVSGSEKLGCDRFQAGFISPRIASLVLSDPTIEAFSIANADSRTFELLEKLIRGEQVVLDELNVSTFSVLSHDLGNPELSAQILDFIDGCDELSVSNCILRLKHKSRMGVEVNGEIEFIASHITELKGDDLRGVEVGVLSEILCSKAMRIPNEDWLLELIFTVCPGYSELLGEVRFEYLSPSSIDLFFERVSFEELDCAVWARLRIRCRHRLVYDSSELTPNSLTGCVTRTADPQLPFSGLINHLEAVCGGNVHTNGAVSITCSSTAHNQCWQVVDYNWTDYWYSDALANSWIQFDFKDRVVSLTHYALKSHHGSSNFLIQWTLSGSTDGNSWTVLDRRNTQDLNGRSITKIFECNERFSVGEFYRYIRLTQTGKTASNQDYLLLTNIEFFGTMKNSTSDCGAIPQRILHNS